MRQLDEDSRENHQGIRVTASGGVLDEGSESGQVRARLARKTLGHFAVRLTQEFLQSSTVTPGLRFSAEENTLYSAWKASVYKSAGEPDCDSSASESDAVEEVMGSSSVSGVKEVIAGSETSDRDSRGSSAEVDSREARSSAGGSMPSLEAPDGIHGVEDSEHDFPVSDPVEHD